MRTWLLKSGGLSCGFMPACRFDLSEPSFSSVRLLESYEFSCIVINASIFLPQHRFFEGLEIIRDNPRSSINLGERHSSYEFKGDACRLQGLKERLSWQNEAAELQLQKASGASLLFWAAMADDYSSVREILRNESREIDRGLTVNISELSIWAQTTPLMVAMAWARWALVETLLDAGAKPTLSDSQQKDALLWAALVGNDENIRGWMMRYPDWNLERREAEVGMTALHLAVFVGSHIQKQKTMEALLEHGADPLTIAHNGAHLLGFAAINPDFSPETMQWLLDWNNKKALPLLHLGLQPRTMKWRAILPICRFLARIGSRSKLVNELASWEGLTPLHDAGRLGHHEISEVLARNGALFEARTAQGLTPLQVTAKFLGGTIPKVIEKSMSRNRLSIKEIQDI